VVTVLSMPMRRLLNLKATSGDPAPGRLRRRPGLDRDGVQVDGQPYWQLVRSWYRHEYTGKGVADVVAIKFIAC